METAGSRSARRFQGRRKPGPPAPTPSKKANLCHFAPYALRTGPASSKSSFDVATSSGTWENGSSLFFDLRLLLLESRSEISRLKIWPFSLDTTYYSSLEYPKLVPKETQPGAFPTPNS
eukprot:scaffold135802_cov31-Tisochrysis_lutea.AAC.1